MVLTVAVEATDGVGETAPLRVASEEPYRVDGALVLVLTPGRTLEGRALEVRELGGAIAMRLCSRSERVVRCDATMGNYLEVFVLLFVLVEAVGMPRECFSCCTFA